MTTGPLPVSKIRRRALPREVTPGDKSLGGGFLTSVFAILAPGGSLLGLTGLMEGDKVLMVSVAVWVLGVFRPLLILVGFRGCKLIDVLNFALGFNGFVFNSNFTTLVFGGDGRSIVRGCEFFCFWGTLFLSDDASRFCISGFSGDRLVDAPWLIIINNAPTAIESETDARLMFIFSCITECLIIRCLISLRAVPFLPRVARVLCVVSSVA